MFLVTIFLTFGNYFQFPKVWISRRSINEAQLFVSEVAKQHSVNYFFSANTIFLIVELIKKLKQFPTQ